jgi:hypothetical protein
MFESSKYRTSLFLSNFDTGFFQNADSYGLIMDDNKMSTTTTDTNTSCECEMPECSDRCFPLKIE